MGVLGFGVKEGAVHFSGFIKCGVLYTLLSHSIVTDVLGLGFNRSVFSSLRCGKTGKENGGAVGLLLEPKFLEFGEESLNDGLCDLLVGSGKINGADDLDSFLCGGGGSARM